VRFLEDLLFESQTDAKPGMSVSITNNRVIPFEYTEEFHNNRYHFLKKLHSWILSNCNICIAHNKLDALIALREKMENESWHSNYIIDTAFLANDANTYLISDDKILFTLLNPSSNIMSSEIFLDTNFQERWRRN
jgi:hypothetical protein